MMKIFMIIFSNYKKQAAANIHVYPAAALKQSSVV